MHAIVMVHKMQSMTLSNHQLLPNKTENTTNNDNDTTANDATADMVESDNTGEDHVMPEPTLQHMYLVLTYCPK